MIAALFVDEKGPYANLPGVDAWGLTRDARKFKGPARGVYHPPCQRYSVLSYCRPENRARIGQDDGCFASALANVREFGGVLEHPAYSLAWPMFGLNKPPTKGGWIKADDLGGWTCCVEQGHYGHVARKGTWLYAIGISTPDLIWGASHVGGTAVNVALLGRRKRLLTPIPFRDLLLGMVGYGDK